MKTKKFIFSISQEIFLSSTIRSEIMRKYAFIDAFRSVGSDTTLLRDDIFELKALYRQLFGEPFRI